MEFFNSLGQVLSNAKNYPAWDQQEKLKTLKQQKLLAQNPPTKQQTAEAKEYSRVMVEAINKMDQYSIDKSEDVLAITQPAVGIASLLAMGVVFGGAFLASTTKPWQKFANDSATKLKDWVTNFKFVKNDPELLQNATEQLSGEGGRKAVNYLAAGALGVLLGIGIAIADAIVVRGVEKEASRVARFQAREEVLDDPQNFVNYTPEQLAEAEKMAAKSLATDKKKKKKSLNPITLFTDSVKTTKELSDKHTTYERWKQKFHEKEAEALKNTNPATYSQAEVEEAKADQNRITGIIKQVELKSQQYLANAEMAINLALLSSSAIGAGLALGVNGLIGAAQHFKALPSDEAKPALGLVKKGLAFIVPALFPLVIAPYVIKLQKEAAKIGRFKAKQELLKHPENFITFTDEEKKNTQGVKAPPIQKKSFFQSVKDEAKFFFNLKNDLKEYEAHEKGAGIKEYRLNKALEDIEVSPEQQAQAEKLQKRAFYAFEKMDEKTQRYSDDVEGGTDIVKSLVEEATELGAEAIEYGAIAYLGYKAIKKGETSQIQKSPLGFMNAITPNSLWIALFSTGLSIPLAITTIWAAQMKKTAAQVGVMLSMKELDDPKRMLVAPSLPLVLPKLKVVEEADDTDDSLPTRTTTPAIKKKPTTVVKPVEAVVDSDDVPDDDEAIA
jgi:hypothetical protein